MEKEICLLCGCQNPEICNEEKEYELNNQVVTITHEYYFCPECKEEWVTPEQTDKVTDKILHLKRKAHRFLLPAEIKELRERHGLTQEQAATIFGGGRNAFSKYERGESFPSRSMDNLMRLFDECSEAKKFLILKSNLPEKEKNYLQSAILAIEAEKILPAQQIFIYEKCIHVIMTITDNTTSWGKHETK